MSRTYKEDETGWSAAKPSTTRASIYNMAKVLGQHPQSLTPSPSHLNTR